MCLPSTSQLVVIFGYLKGANKMCFEHQRTSELEAQHHTMACELDLSERTGSLCGAGCEPTRSSTITTAAATLSIVCQVHLEGGIKNVSVKSPAKAA